MPNTQEVNTITFLINPTYTLNGSLDGMVGNRPADEEFYGHVPEMRARYGSEYPASYFRFREAFALRDKIELEDADREKTFTQYNSQLVDTESLKRSNKDSGISKKQQPSEDDAGKGTAEIEDKQRGFQDGLTGADKYYGWQRTMEELLEAAGKRNIANTYVWDADGGMRAETQEFASTIQHTIGGTFNLEASLGVVFQYYGGAAVELSAAATFHLKQTMTKSETRSRGFSLNVHVAPENRDVTDQYDYPLYPGLKVDRYRFMSFYLEPSADHFDAFFNEVVDPVWLMSNDEEARALRQIDRVKRNKAWRVLHRITYVERPVLMGFGGDGQQREKENLGFVLGTMDERLSLIEKMLTQLLEAQSKSGN